jgi:hypothetical protein
LSAAISPVRWMDRTRSIYCIGDSNVISYDRLAARDLRSGTFYSCRSIHLRRFFYSEEMDPIHAKFHQRMWSALERNSLADGPLGSKTVYDPILLIVFSLGYWAGPLLELHENDFIIPEAPTPILTSVDPEKELIPYGLVVERVKVHLKPYIDELSQLRNGGFRDVFVLAMHPPHPDDDVFFSVFPAMGKKTAVTARYKVLHVFNSLLRMQAAEIGIDSIDPFDRLTIDGVLDPKFNLDNAHLNRAAARISIETLIGRLR